MLETNTHVYFWGNGNDHPIPSNFYICPVRIKLTPHAEPITFRSSEHAFMAQKALVFNAFHIVDELTRVIEPKDAKALGRAIIPFDEDKWSTLSTEAMYNACLAKFMQNQDAQDWLLGTGSKILVEGSPSDRIWGVGLRWDNPKILDKANWRGENRLGRILMLIRWDIHQYLQSNRPLKFNPKGFESYAH